MKKEIRPLFYFTLVYLVFFSVLAVVNRNYEFIYYIIVMSSLIYLIIFYHKSLKLSWQIMAGLALVGLLHIAGGNLWFSGIRLYDIWLIPWVKYDNLVHFFALFVTTIIVYSLLAPHLDRKIKHNRYLLALLVVLIAMGIGALNEVIEFLVVLFGAPNGVGDYMNNALDLVFNMLGSIAGCLVLFKHI